MQILPDRIEAPTLYSLGVSLGKWAEGVLDMVGDGPLIVVGSSMGGSCALEVARQAPERVAALVLVGSKAGHNPDPAYRDATVATLERHGAEGLWSEIRRDLVGEQARSDVVSRIKALMLEQQTEDLVRAVRVFHSRPDANDVVAQWDKPLLAVCGDQDRVVTESKTTTLTQNARLGALYVMRGCGHYMNMERPGEFGSVISSFITAVEDNAASHQ